MTPSIYSLFVLGAVLTCVLTPLIRFLAMHNGFVDCPQRARKVHKQATPRLGGAAVLFSFLIAVAILWIDGERTSDLIYGSNPVLGSIILGSIGIFLIGFFDDLSGLSAKTKLIGEFLIAGLVVWAADFSFTSTKFLGLGSVAFPEWLGFWTFMSVDCWFGKCD